MSGDARRRIIEEHLPLVAALAHRYEHRGESYEDLLQVGAVGLIKAVDRYEPRRGVELGAYAVPTIVGEIKRHLRDRTWPVSVPRSLRESRPLAEFVSPLTAADAEGTGARPDAVLEAERERELGESRALLATGLRVLGARERQVLSLSFFADLSQAEIGDRLGMSQVQVSRLLRRGLERLRGVMGPADPLTGPEPSSTFERVTKATNGGAQ